MLPNDSFDPKYWSQEKLWITGIVVAAVAHTVFGLAIEVGTGLGGLLLTSIPIMCRILTAHTLEAYRARQEDNMGQVIERLVIVAFGILELRWRLLQHGLSFFAR